MQSLKRRDAIKSKKFWLWKAFITIIREKRIASVRKSIAWIQTEGAGRTIQTADKASNNAAKRTGSRFIKFLKFNKRLFIVQKEYHKRET